MLPNQRVGSGSPTRNTAALAATSLAPPALADGTADVIGGTANVIPDELVAVHRAAAANDLSRARAEREWIYPLVDTILVACQNCRGVL
jgi:dihydrodipicolinate synthase/N-acetylneuraminate lyase